MKLNRTKLQKEIHALYGREHAALGESGTLDLLERARQWDLSDTLANQGVIVFPHAGVADCGHQIAAAVHACLDSGADRVIIISVLHAFTAEMENARIEVANGGLIQPSILFGAFRGRGWQTAVPNGAAITP